MSRRLFLVLLSGMLGVLGITEAFAQQKGSTL